jgi:hypothetical protein
MDDIRTPKNREDKRKNLRSSPAKDDILGVSTIGSPSIKPSLKRKSLYFQDF